MLKGPELSENHHGRSAQHRPLAEGRCRCRKTVCAGILWLFKASRLGIRRGLAGGSDRS